MEKIKHYSLVIFLIFLLFYVFGTFIASSIDFTTWKTGGRVIMVIFVVVSSLLYIGTKEKW